MLRIYCGSVEFLSLDCSVVHLVTSGGWPAYIPKLITCSVIASYVHVRTLEGSGELTISIAVQPKLCTYAC